MKKIINLDKTSFVLIWLLLIPQITLAEAYQTEIGLVHSSTDYGDYLGLGVDFEETLTGIGIQYNFEPVSAVGPLAEATFMSRASNVTALLSTGDFGTSSFKVDTESWFVAGTFFVNKDVAINVEHSQTDVESIGDLSSNSLQAIVYTKEYMAFAFGLTAADYGYDVRTINLDTKSVFVNDNNSFALDTTIQMHDASDFDANWTVFGFGLTFYPEDTTGIGFSLASTSGDAEDSIAFGLSASKFVADNFYIEAVYAHTANDTLDDASTITLALGIRL